MKILHCSLATSFTCTQTAIQKVTSVVSEANLSSRRSPTSMPSRMTHFKHVSFTLRCTALQNVVATTDLNALPFKNSLATTGSNDHDRSWPSTILYQKGLHVLSSTTSTSIWQAWNRLSSSVPKTLMLRFTICWQISQTGMTLPSRRSVSETKTHSTHLTCDEEVDPSTGKTTCFYSANSTLTTRIL